MKSVKSNVITRIEKVAKTKEFVFDDGERACVITDMQGMPLYYPNLYLTTQVRNRSLSSSSLANIAGHLCVFLQILSECGINLIDRFSKGVALENYEVEALRGYMQRRLLAQPEGLARTCFAGKVHVSKEIVRARTGAAVDYVSWLAGRYLKSPVDPEALARVLSAMKDIRPLNKKRNLLYRDNGLDDVTASAIREVLKPDSSYRLWDEDGVQSRNKLMFTLLYELGIRRGELLNIKCEDINFHSNRIYIVRRADEKSDPRVRQPLVKTNDRELVGKAHVIKALQEYILTYRRKVSGARKHGYLFVTHKAGPTLGQPLSIAGYKDVVNSLRTHIPPLKDFTGHQLRHYWNERFSDLADERKLGAAEEERLRSMLMGWKLGSGTAATYNKRADRRKATEFGLALQEKTLRPVEVRRND